MNKWIIIIICVMLIMIGVAVREKVMWDKIIILIAAVLGYIFGTMQED